MLDTVKEMAHKHFQGARGSHNWDHTLDTVYRIQSEHLGAKPEGLKLADLRHAYYGRIL